MSARGGYTLGLLAGVAYLTGIGAFSTLTIPHGGWGVWLLVGPLDAILLVAIWLVWHE